MSFTKPQIFNLALSALLLSKEISDTATDTSNECRVLNLHYDLALESTLRDLDLDCFSTPITLALIEEIDDEDIPWAYAYEYPSNCAFLRRIVSGQLIDYSYTHIPKRVGMYEGEKAIFTDQEDAVAECMPKDIPLSVWPANAGLALAYKLAFLSAPLIVGKGAKALKDDIDKNYRIAKAEAQEHDASENFIYEQDHIRSEFVAARLE